MPEIKGLRKQLPSQQPAIQRIWEGYVLEVSVCPQLEGGTSSPVPGLARGILPSIVTGPVPGPVQGVLPARRFLLNQDKEIPRKEAN